MRTGELLGMMDGSLQRFPFKYLLVQDVPPLSNLTPPSEEKKNAFATLHGIPPTKVKIRLGFHLFDHPICWQYFACICSLPYPCQEVVGAIMLPLEEWNTKFPNTSAQDVIRSLELNQVPPLELLRFDMVF